MVWFVIKSKLSHASCPEGAPGLLGKTVLSITMAVYNWLPAEREVWERAKLKG